MRLTDILLKVTSLQGVAWLSVLAMAIWIVLAALFAYYFFAVPHGPDFAPELGPRDAFLVFGIAYSLVYAGIAGLIMGALALCGAIVRKHIRLANRPGFEVIPQRSADAGDP